MDFLVRSEEARLWLDGVRCFSFHLGSSIKSLRDNTVSLNSQSPIFFIYEVEIMTTSTYSVHEESNEIVPGKTLAQGLAPNKGKQLYGTIFGQWKKRGPTGKIFWWMY